MGPDTNYSIVRGFLFLRFFSFFFFFLSSIRYIYNIIIFTSKYMFTDPGYWEKARAHERVAGWKSERETRRALATSHDALSRLNEEDGTTRGTTSRRRAASSSVSWARASAGCVTALARLSTTTCSMSKKPGKWQSRGAYPW